MGMIRLIAAFLFAVVLLVVAYGVFWFVAFRFAEQRMASMLQGQLGAVVSYDVPQWQPQFNKVSVSFPQMLARIAMPEGEVVVLELPEVTLQSGFFDDGSELKLIFPQAFVARVMRNDQPVVSYQVMTSGMEMFIYNNMLMVSSRAGRIAVGESLVLTWQNGRLKWEPLADGAAKVLVQAQRVQSVAGDVDDIAVRGTVMGMQAMTAPTWALLRLANKQALSMWLQHGVQALAQGGELSIEGLTLKKADWTFALSGNVGVDGGDGVPTGDFVVQANTGDGVAEAIEKSGVAVPGRTEERMRYDQAMVRLAQGEPVGKLVLHQGVAILNTLRVGRVPSATTIVRGWL